MTRSLVDWSKLLIHPAAAVIRIRSGMPGEQIIGLEQDKGM